MGSKRRSKTSQRVRAIAVVLANVACGLVLWRALADRGSAAASEPSRADALLVESQRAQVPADMHVDVEAVERSARDEPSEPSTRRKTDRALQSAMRQTANKWIARAVREAKGKLEAREVAVSVHVRELGVAGEVVAIAADRPMRPASNMKLVTTAAALVLLGPDWTFDTRFSSEASVVEGRLQGDLVVHAAGDPFYDEDADGEVAKLFEPAVRDLWSRGVRIVEGALVLDEGAFQDPKPAPGWPSENQHWEEFCALAGGFSANAGCITAVVRATKDGRASVAVHPRGHGMPSRIDVATGSPKSKLDIRVGARTGTVIVEGRIPRDVAEWSTRFAAPDPVTLFGNALLDSLARRGITVKGGVERARVPASTRARELARLSTSLSTTLVPINTHSNNACADQLFLAVGNAVEGAGTRAASSRATARALEKLGISADGLVQVDGSGLSRDNRTTARQITALIDAVLRVPGSTSERFADSLAVGGTTGTLDGRMQSPRLRERVHAKTGFIGGTSALSGFVDGFDGRTFVFSILVEYPSIEGLNKTCWKPMQDEMCAALVGSDE